MRISKELGDDWMDTSDDGNVVVYNYHKKILICDFAFNLIVLMCEMQGRENDVLSIAMKSSFIQNVE